MIFVRSQPFGQRFERSVRGRARARERRVAAILPVPGIIDQQKRVTVRRILPKNRRPIEPERTLPAKRNRKPFSRWMNSGNVIGHIFRRRYGVINFESVGRQSVDIALIVRTRMVNQRVLSKIEGRQCNQKNNEKSGTEADYSSRPTARWRISHRPGRTDPPR